MESFHNAIFSRVSAALKVETIRVEVIRVVGGGDSAWAAVELVATATSKYGELEISFLNHVSCLCSFFPTDDACVLVHPLDKPYRVEYVDLVRFNSQGKIAQLKEFFDSGHIQSHVVEHESKTKDSK